MNKEKSRLLEFVAKTFFIAVICNVTIDLTIIHYNTDTTMALLPDTFKLFSLVSLLAFFVICLTIYLISKIVEKGNPEKTFWYNMYFGVCAAGLIFFMLKDTFVKYYVWPEVFSMVAVFAILVSLASQYQLYIGDDGSDIEMDEVSGEPKKAFSPEEGIFGI